MRTVVEITADIVAANAEAKALRERTAELYKERDLAMVEEATPHEWAGRRVRRTLTGFRSSTIQRGRIAQNTFETPVYGIRGYRAAAGEWYVASPSGSTGYALKPRWKSEGAWELDE